jgi:hypothetical protein
MPRPRSRLLLSLLALVGLAATGLAQDRTPAPPGPGGAEEVDDPFVTPPSLRRAGEGVAFTTTGSLLAALPGLGVRGTLEVKDRPPAAILALGPRTTPAPARANPLADGEQRPQVLAPQEKTVVVRAGDRISFVKDGVDISIDVLAIAQGCVTLRIGGETGPSITLR